MKFAIRADASREIGHGHVTRCLTLAAALRAAGGRVLFVCRKLSGDLLDRIEREGFPVRQLPATATTAAADARETRVALDAHGPVDWLIVDHYGLGATWERSMRTHAQRVMVIDDLADRRHDCDLLLDQNVVANAARRYHGLVPDQCALLLGPEYALLQAVYRRLREQTPLRQAPVRRMLISWGGADNFGLTGRSLAAVLRAAGNGVAVDVVVTRGHRDADEVRQVAQRHANVSVHADLPTLAPLMAAADVSIGAGGTTSWERLCLGVPSIVASIAENQRAIAQELSRRDLIMYLGHYDQVTDDQLVQAVREVLTRELTAWSAACRAVVDGCGTERVATVLSLATPRLRARPADPRDEALLLDWVNDPATRSSAMNTHRITAEEHHAWLTGRLRDPDCRMFILETLDGEPIGQVRFDRAPDGWKIDYSVAPAWRGQGFGRAVLRAAMHSLQAEDPHAAFIGIVKEANQASRRVFESLGFMAQSADGIVEYRSRPVAAIAP
jgi:UDP-2,4-diacetamido-2,4,6-trideoxy-beta-L-altropyranose hydrolase